MVQHSAQDVTEYAELKEETKLNAHFEGSMDVFL